MTADARFERDLPAILEDLYLGPSPEYRHEALAAAMHRRQRPSWTFPGRWLPVADMVSAPLAFAGPFPLRAIGVALVLIALLLATLAFVAGSQQPRVPPPFGPARNGLIVYPTGGDVYALDPATGRTTPLVSGRSGDLDALYSPDGAHIAFSRLSENRTPATLTILVANADGSHPTSITTTPLAADGLRFEWAPDSRSLYVQTGLFDTGPLEVLQLDVTGKAEPRTLVTGGELLRSAARPPDGKELLIRRTHGQWHQLLVLDIATGVERLIADGGQDSIRSARWSTSGEQVAYSRTEPGDPATVRLWVVNADGTGDHQVTFGSGTWANEDPSWSPDDRRIAFTQYERTSTDPATWDIRPIGILDVASGTTVSVGPLSRDVRKAHPTANDLTARSAERLAFDWSPDGTTLLAVPTEASGHPILIDPSTNTWTVLDTIFDEQGGAAQAWQRTAP